MESEVSQLAGSAMERFGQNGERFILCEGLRQLTDDRFILIVVAQASGNEFAKETKIGAAMATTSGESTRSVMIFLKRHTGIFFMIK